MPDITDFDPYEALPHDKDIPRIVLMLLKDSSDSVHILTYHGVFGAGWIAAYASDVLGLETCILNAAGKSLPISGTYKHARVVIRLSSKDSTYTCELSTVGSGVEECIELAPPESLIRCGWSIDCSSLNFLDASLPQLRDSAQFEGFCEFVAVEIFNTISDLVHGPPSGVTNPMSYFILLPLSLWRNYMIVD